MTVAQSIDGAQLSKHLSHTTAGFKLNDLAAICPVSGVPMFASRDGAVVKSQSGNLCFPLKIAMKGETKQSVEQNFCDMFDFLQIVGWMVQIWPQDGTS